MLGQAGLDSEAQEAQRPEAGLFPLPPPPMALFHVLRSHWRCTQRKGLPLSSMKITHLRFRNLRPEKGT